ncbi:hypothetical protein, partial [Pseudomonas coronafaciens]|uniref:hypothetical protein n=1 Tax=Pseudomonas coronafaciens TaxID=53409 RepID=UPI000AD52879
CETGKAYHIRLAGPTGRRQSGCFSGGLQFFPAQIGMGALAAPIVSERFTYALPFDRTVCVIAFNYRQFEHRIC